MNMNMNQFVPTQQPSRRMGPMSNARCQWLFVLSFSVCIGLPMVSAFQLAMDYKPPVKSSVKKLIDRRFSIGRRESVLGKVDHTTDSRSSSSSSKPAYAGVYAPPPTSHGVETFERRMRNLVLGTQQRRRDSISMPVPRHNNLTLPRNVHVVESLYDYKRIVGDEREKVVAVRFYATYCRACHAVAPHYYHLARKFPDTIFVDVPVTPENASLHQGLGIPSLPYGHIYHPQAGLVEEMPLTRNHVGKFRSKLESYVNGCCDLSCQPELESVMLD